MTRLIKIKGNAGTGKTRKCLDMAEKEINSGLDEDDLLFLTYTNAAADEARNRIAERLGKDPSDLSNKWKTIHSMCFNLLSLRRNDVAMKKRKNFCENMGIEYHRDLEEAGPSELDFREEPFGNKVFSAYDLMRSTEQDLSSGSQAIEQIFRREDLNKDPIDIMKLWEYYKIEHDLVDFVDMLSGVLRLNLVPDAEVMIVDEFQDISPLDYEVYKLWKNNMEKVYIAGSIPQTIYSFRGAHPKYFYEEEEDKLINNNKSWRVPKKICKEAQKVLDTMDYMNDAYESLEPADRRGKFLIKYCDQSMSQLEEEMYDALYGDAVNEQNKSYAEFQGYEMLSEIDSAIDNDQSVMALFRTRFQTGDFAKRLIRIGVPFKSMRTYPVWTDRLVDLREGIKDLSKGKKIKGVKKRRVSNLLEDSIYNVSKSWVKDEAKGIIRDRAELDIDYGERSLLAKEYPLSWYQAKAIVESIENDRMDVDPSQIRVGTKHSSKGKESDVVITSFDTSSRIGINRYFKSKTIEDEERRVDYVAMTRAREKIFIEESGWSGIPNHTLKALQGEED